MTEFDGKMTGFWLDLDTILQRERSLVTETPDTGLGQSQESDQKRMRLSIITPTLLRESLIETCRSIDSQEYSLWEHILMVDVVPDGRGMEILREIQHKNRIIILANLAGEPGGYPGSRLRHMAGLRALGEYLLYIDDDDVYFPGAFERVALGLAKRPVWAMFPVLRFNQRFYNPGNIAWSFVSGIQIVHKRGYLWPKENEPADDWYFIEFLETIHGAPARIDGPELAQITKTGGADPWESISSLGG